VTVVAMALFPESKAILKHHFTTNCGSGCADRQLVWRSPLGHWGSGFGGI
jgi:hypothetical protein